jgi:hypothetical protein
MSGPLRIWMKGWIATTKVAQNTLNQSVLDNWCTLKKITIARCRIECTGYAESCHHLRITSPFTLIGLKAVVQNLAEIKLFENIGNRTFFLIEMGRCAIYLGKARALVCCRCIYGGNRIDLDLTF